MDNASVTKNAKTWQTNMFHVEDGTNFFKQKNCFETTKGDCKTVVTTRKRDIDKTIDNKTLYDVITCIIGFLSLEQLCQPTKFS